MLQSQFASMQLAHQQQQIHVQSPPPLTGYQSPLIVSQPQHLLQPSQSRSPPIRQFQPSSSQSIILHSPAYQNQPIPHHSAPSPLVDYLQVAEEERQNVAASIQQAQERIHFSTTRMTESIQRLTQELEQVRSERDALANQVQQLQAARESDFRWESYAHQLEEKIQNVVAGLSTNQVQILQPYPSTSSQPMNHTTLNRRLSSPYQQALMAQPRYQANPPQFPLLPSVAATTLTPLSPTPSSTFETSSASVMKQAYLSSMLDALRHEHLTKPEMTQPKQTLSTPIKSIQNYSVSASHPSLLSPPVSSASPPVSNGIESVTAGSSLLDFLLIVGKCKYEKRTGWVNEKVPLPESVADHMYRMALMAMTCIDYQTIDSSASPTTAISTQIDPFRAIQMALVHDLAEALTTDITPTQFSGVTKADKHQLELNAMNTICDKLRQAHSSAAVTTNSTAAGSFPIADHIYQLWLEYEGGSTPTAKYVKNLDKLDMYIQAYEYQLEAFQRDQQPIDPTIPTSSNSSHDAPHKSDLRHRLERFFTSVPETLQKLSDQSPPSSSSAGVSSLALPPSQHLLSSVLLELDHRRQILANKS